MKFKTPCFVRVEDAEKREELIEWLAQIGYRLKDLILNDNLDCIVTGADTARSTNMERFDFWITSVPYVGRIDCGNNIELFKALAAMNYNNDYMQWFTDGRDWRLCPDVIVTKMVIPSYALYRKATAEEIIEHFKTTHL